MCGIIVDAFILMMVIRFMSEEEQDFFNMLLIAAPSAIVGAAVQFGLASAMVGSGFVGLPALIVFVLVSGVVQLILLGAMMVWVLKVDLKPALTMAFVFFVVRSAIGIALQFMLMK